MRRLLAGLAVAAGLLLAAGPAAAENPVLDPEDDAEIAESLAEATEVQDVCYGYLLQVYDDSTGQFSGDYAVSGAGPGVAASSSTGCTRGYVELRAQIVYTSDYSESEDSAGWDVVSSLGAGSPTTADLGDLGLSSGDLLDDGAAPLALRNAVLALPALAADRAGLPPVEAEPHVEPLPEGAAATGSPGSDVLRSSAAPLALAGIAVVAGVVLLISSFSRPATFQ